MTEVTADTAPPPPKSGTKAQPPEGNIKETIESILVAFILAFVFRAFVVEAFVIPTGSMAPTLMGAHMHFQCPDCGYAFDVNYSSGKSDLVAPARNNVQIKLPIYCPNCGFQIRQTAGPGEDSLNQPPVHYGDRILVLKYRYLLSDPQRWDVIVFKSPDAPPPGVQEFYVTNYIKRLIGKPGESIMILDGDIYVSTAPPPADPNDRSAMDAFHKTFKIQRKPRHAQMALWRNIYDNDYLPHLPVDQRSGNPWAQPWVAGAGSGWDVGQNLPESIRGRTRTFHFASDTAAGELQFNPDLNADKHALTDFLAYDQYNYDSRRFTDPAGNDELSRPNKNVVSDLKLSCFYHRESGAGPFRMIMTKRNQKIVAELTPGQVTLSRYDLNTGKLLKQYGPAPLPNTATALEVDLANADYRASVRVNDKELLSSGDDYEPSPDDIVRFIDDENNSVSVPVPLVKIEAAQQRATLEHITLSRDVFYINDRNHGGRPNLLGSPDHVVTLKAEEYFALGDNSLISGDGRMWQNDVILPGEDLPFVERGRVPARFLLGKAFFVYWPAGHRPFGIDWGIIPNFGDMRFIR